MRITLAALLVAAFASNAALLAQHWVTVDPGPSPAARNHHGMAYDEYRRVVVLFGGEVERTKPMSDTWEWDG